MCTHETDSTVGGFGITETFMREGDYLRDDDKPTDIDSQGIVSSH